MKTTMTFKSITMITLLGTALAAPVLAQPGFGMGGGGGRGGGWGGGPCMQNAGPGAGMGSGAGMGPGARSGRGRMMFNQNNTRGWTLMTPEERTAFQSSMREVKTYDECVQTQTQHRGLMEVRAKEKGVALMAPRQNVCENLQARGLIK